jgi:hypothetical protein
VPKVPLNYEAQCIQAAIARAFKNHLPPAEIAALRARYEIAAAESMIQHGEARLRELTGGGDG